MGKTAELCIRAERKIKRFGNDSKEIQGGSQRNSIPEGKNALDVGAC